MRSPPIAAIVLAAGLGSRFGGRKLQARLAGRPILQHVLDLAAAARLDPVVVVLGTDADELLAACEWHAEIRVVNPRPDDGISSSVRLGLAAIESSPAERAVVLLGDQPWLTLEQLSAVAGNPGPIVVPRYHGRPGNPVALDRAAWPLAASLQGDRGFSQLFADHPQDVAYIDLPGTNPDIDVQADLRPS